MNSVVHRFGDWRKGEAVNTPSHRLVGMGGSGAAGGTRMDAALKLHGLPFPSLLRYLQIPFSLRTALISSCTGLSESCFHRRRFDLHLDAVLHNLCG